MSVWKNHKSFKKIQSRTKQSPSGDSYRYMSNPFKYTSLTCVPGLALNSLYP